jgi:hypothetical protein
MEMNSIIWVSKQEILGGAKFSVSATLPVANNSLTSDEAGTVRLSRLPRKPAEYFTGSQHNRYWTKVQYPDHL